MTTQPPAAASSPTEAAQTTACADLLASGWKAPGTDPDISWDPEAGTGLVTVRYTDENDTLVLNFFSDADCLKLPDLAPLVSSVRDGAE